MAATRFTPRIVKTLLAGETLLLVALIILAKSGLFARHSRLEELIGLGFGAVARGIAVTLFLGIADEYRKVRLSRLAWQALAINAGLLFIKGVVSSSVIDAFIENYHNTPWRGFLNHALGVPASVFLLLGLMGLLQSYRSAGLGAKLRGSDYVIMAVSLALFGWVLIVHKNLEEGQSPWLINRILQPLDLSLIGVASIVSVLLHRHAASISGGKLAEALRWLVIYGLMPGVLVLLVQFAVPAIQRTVSFDASPLGTLWRLLPWMMTLAAAVRAEVTSDAVAQVTRLRHFNQRTKVVGSELSAEG